MPEILAPFRARGVVSLAQPRYSQRLGVVEGDTVLVVDVAVTLLVKSKVIGDVSLLIAGVVVLLDSTLEVGAEVAETGVAVLVDSTTGTVDGASVLETSIGLLVLSDAG